MSPTAAKRHISDGERRRRMVVRHHLDGQAPSIESAVRAMLVLHSSDPATPFLALAARVPGVTREGVETALYRNRTLWRLHAMRRTMFVVNPADADDLYLACGLKVAASERRRVLKWVTSALADPERCRAIGIHADLTDPNEWLRTVEDQVVAAVTAGDGTTTTQLRATVQGLDLTLTFGSGKYVQDSPLASRLLYLLAMEGRILRGRPVGTWRASQYAWVDPTSWFGPDRLDLRFYGPHAEPSTPADQAEAKARMAKRYLQTHGPATAEDLKWFMGWTVTDTRRALQALDLAEVTTDEGTAVLLADDLDSPPPADEPVLTFLPSLDPAPMGWKGRGWYLGDLDRYPSPMFDRAGNVGPSVMLDGRVVGGWAQRPDGDIAWRLLRQVSDDVAAHIGPKADALARWIGEDAVTPRFPTPLSRDLTT